MPGRDQQKKRELKRAAQSCSKLTDLFKRSKTSTKESFDGDEIQEKSGKEMFFIFKL